MYTSIFLKILSESEEPARRARILRFKGRMRISLTPSKKKMGVLSELIRVGYLVYVGVR